MFEILDIFTSTTTGDTLMTVLVFVHSDWVIYSSIQKIKYSMSSFTVTESNFSLVLFSSETFNRVVLGIL